MTRHASVSDEKQKLSSEVVVTELGDAGRGGGGEGGEFFRRAPMTFVVGESGGRGGGAEGEGERVGQEGKGGGGGGEGGYTGHP